MAPRSHGRWHIIAPFLRVLHGHTVLLSQDVRTGRLQSLCTGFVLTLDPLVTREEQRRIRVAIELLHTMWTLDRDAWRSALALGVGVRFLASPVLLEPDQTPFFAVTFRHDKFPWQLRASRWSVLLSSSVALTEEEARARALLLSKYGRLTGRVTQHGHVPLRLMFEVFGMATSVVEDYMAQAVATVETVRAELLQGPGDAITGYGRCTPFALDAMDLDLSAYEMTSGIAGHVIRLHALGVPFNYLTLRLNDSDFSDEPMSSTDCDRLLTTLAPPRSQPGAQFSLTSLAIDRVGLQQFSAACSAIERTGAVKNLQLQSIFTFDNPLERHLKWQWLTQAVFSPASRTSVKHLSMNQTELELSDIDAVAAALASVEEHRCLDQSHALETLIIGCEASQHDTLTAIPRLVQQIGQDLRCFSVYLWMGALPQPAVLDILSTCRRLEFLDLSSVVLDSLYVFIDAYESLGCRIRSLSLQSVQVSNASVTTFAHVLCDPHRRMTQTLCELCIDSVGEQNALTNDNLDAFLAVLHVNSQLEYLALHMDDAQLTTYRARFAKHDQKWLPKASECFSLACKTAMLSVARPFRGKSSPAVPVLSLLDDRVLSLVFAFAAPRARRTVFVDES